MENTLAYCGAATITAIKNCSTEAYGVTMGINLLIFCKLDCLVTMEKGFKVNEMV
jgi:hypothetical protein